MQTQAFKASTRFGVAPKAACVRPSAARRPAVVVRAAAAAEQGAGVDEMGFKLMRKGVKVAAQESILTPRYVDEVVELLRGPPRAPQPTVLALPHAGHSLARPLFLGGRRAASLPGGASRVVGVRANLSRQARPGFPSSECPIG